MTLQILKKMIAHSLKLEEDGTAFCDFRHITIGLNEFKNKYRARLDALPIDANTADQIVEEANVAFQLNMSLFDDLEKEIIGAANAGKSAPAYIQPKNSWVLDAGALLMVIIGLIAMVYLGTSQ